MSVINTNVQALKSAQTLGRNQELLNNSLNRLSSGSKLANAADDPAGLGVSDKLTAQDKRLNAAATNIQNAVSYTQATDGMLSGMGKILSRMSELQSLSQDVTKNSADIDLYQQEFQTLQDQLRLTIGGSTSEIGGTTDIDSPLGMFNGVTLFGPNSTGYQIALGDSSSQGMTIPETNLRIDAMLDLIQQDSSGNYSMDITSATADGITSAIQQVADDRATLGAVESRLSLASSAITVQSQNIQSAVSRISDVDVASESTQLAKYNILVQAGTSMLAQANSDPQEVLKLLER